MNKNMWDAAIIGGGASGLVCAIQAASKGIRVIIIERMDRVGKKILATGNGRCNIMNTGDPCYPRGSDFAQSVLAQCDVEEQLAFWESLGLRLREEEDGRVYPASGAAATVLDVLRLTLEALHIEVRTSCEVTAISHHQNGFIIETTQGPVSSRQVVIAGGGCAQEKLGSNGSAARLLASLGHTVHPFAPVLTAMNCPSDILNGLTGQRAKAVISVMKENHCLHQEAGEVLFTDYGLSGVCVMNCSGWWSPGCDISLNLLRALGFRTGQELLEELSDRRLRWATLPIPHLLTGLCVQRLSLSLLKAAGIPLRGTIGALTDRQLRSLSTVCSDLRLQVTGLRGFEQAQVSRGGADPNQFDPQSLASKLIPGLYACGEVLDVDGICGGFNLMFATASGLLAGDALKGY